jgi:hypothetical protein
LTGDCVADALEDAIRRKAPGNKDKQQLQWLLQKRKQQNGAIENQSCPTEPLSGHSIGFATTPE